MDDMFQNFPFLLGEEEVVVFEGEKEAKSEIFFKE